MRISDAKHPHIAPKPDSVRQRLGFLRIGALLYAALLLVAHGSPPPAPWTDNCWLHAAKSHLFASETRVFLPERFVCCIQRDVRTSPDKLRASLQRYGELTQGSVFWQRHPSPSTKSPQLLETFPPSTQTWNPKPTCCSRFAPERTRNIAVTWGLGVYQTAVDRLFHISRAHQCWWRCFLPALLLLCDHRALKIAGRE